jgi:parallel beta-helix repeat protein
MKKAVALPIVLVLVLSVVVVSFVANGYLNTPDYAPNPSQAGTPPPFTPEVSVGTLITPTSPPDGALIVPDDYSTITAAVEGAFDGQAIYVRIGEYNESITVNKSVWLIGEAGAHIDAHSIGADIIINHDNVNVTGFSLNNTPIPGWGGLWQTIGVGLPIQLEDIKVIDSKFCYIYANNFTGSLAAINILNASQSFVVNNYFFGAAELNVGNSNGNTIKNNLFVDGGMAIRIENGASGNFVLDNTVVNSTYAIYINGAPGNTLRNNTLIHNFHSFYVTGNSTTDYVNAVDSTNTIDGKPIYYWVGKSGSSVPLDAGSVVLVNCVDMVVEGLTLPLGTAEITLANTNNSLVKANAILPSDPAHLAAGATPQPPLHIQLYRSFNNNLEDNQANLLLDYSNSNSLIGNQGSMCLTYSDGNRITENQVTPIYFDVANNFGINIVASSSNIIKQNNIAGIYGAGIMVRNGSSSNLIVQNTVANTTGGIMISPDPQDIVYHPDVSDPNMPRSNVIYGNTITGNANQGIMDSGYGTQIIGNTMTKNSNCGIQLLNSQNVLIKGNCIDGIFFGFMGNKTRDIQVIANNITLNNKFTSYCLWLLTNYPATFYHNNFYGQVNFSHYADNYQNSTVSDAADCIWDDAGQGNYWSSYSGVDNDGNGVGDTPQPLGFGYYDNYPLMAPFDVASAVPASPA